MATTSDGRHPVALAFEWISKITAIVFEMVVPAIAGRRLDEEFGWHNRLALAGLALGFFFGMGHLLLMTRGLSNKSASGDLPDSPEIESGEIEPGKDDRRNE